MEWVGHDATHGVRPSVIKICGDRSSTRFRWRSWNAFLLEVDQDLMLAQVDAIASEYNGQPRYALSSLIPVPSLMSWMSSACFRLATQPSASMTVAKPLPPLVILDNRWRMAGWQYCVNHDFHDANGNPVVNKVSDGCANDGSLSQVSSCWADSLP